MLDDQIFQIAQQCLDRILGHLLLRREMNAFRLTRFPSLMLTGNREAIREPNLIIVLYPRQKLPLECPEKTANHLQRGIARLTHRDQRIQMPFNIRNLITGIILICPGQVLDDLRKVKTLQFLLREIISYNWLIKNIQFRTFIPVQFAKIRICRSELPVLKKENRGRRSFYKTDSEEGDREFCFRSMS